VSSNQNILFVLSKPEDWWMVPMLERMSSDMPIKVACLVSNVNDYFTSTNIELILFQEDPRMSGYLPGLESILDHVGMVVCTDNYSVSSFQACRVASKYSIPLMVFCSGVQFHFGDSRSNVRAIKYDINLHSQKFVATSERSKQVLIEDGVEASRVMLISPYIASVAPLGNGQKFRKYFGFDQSRDLIIYHDVLEPNRFNEAVLEAAKLSLNGKSGLKNPVWLVVGQGSNANRLKLEASRQGLHGNVFFLEQDCRTFLNDMLSAADFYIPSLVEDHEQLVPCLGLAHQAFAKGAEILLSKDGFHAEILPEVKIRLSGKKPENILGCLATQATLRRLDGQWKDIRSQANAYGETARLAMKVFLQSHLQKEAMVDDFENILREIEDMISHGRYADIFTRVDDLLLKKGLTDRHIAQIWRLKGDCFAAIGDFMAATSSYEEAIGFDQKCGDAYVGLGMLSLRSRASDEAIAFFGKAYALIPGKQKIAIGMANACADGGLLNEATWWIEKAIGLPGRDFLLLNAVIRIAGIFPEKKAALKFLERIHETVGDHPSLMLGLGKAYLDEGKYELGNKLIRDALEKTAS